MNTDEYEKMTWKTPSDELEDAVENLLAEVKRLREKVEFSHLKDWAIMQAEHMRAEVGDNTWHYAMEVWLYPETHYWDYDEEGMTRTVTES